MASSLPSLESPLAFLEHTLPQAEAAVQHAVPAVLTGLDLGIRWVNRAFLQDFVYEWSALTGRSLLDLAHREHERKKWRDHLRLMRRESAGIHPCWVGLRRGDGSVASSSVVSQPLVDRDGQEGWLHLIYPVQEAEWAIQSYVSDLFVQGWLRALHARDLETSAHTYRVTRLTMAVGRELGMEDRVLQVWRWGALLHDIGKVAIPDSILRKPGPLTPQEWEVMRQHPLLAKRILEVVPFLPAPVLEIPVYHHERWDGSGYPFGLKGEAIPLAARAFAVVDVWDALRSKRPYRLPWPEDRILRYLKTNAGVLFDPMIVDIFITLHREGLPA